MRDRSGKLHETNGGRIDDTGFDWIEAVVGRVKVNKDYNEQHHIWKEEYVEVGIIDTSIGGMHKLKNDMTNIFSPVVDKRIEKDSVEGGESRYDLLKG